MIDYHTEKHQKTQLFLTETSKIQSLWEALPSIQDSVPGLRKEGGELKGPCPKCGGKDRFYLRVDGSWACRQCNQNGGGDLIDFHKWYHGTDIKGLTKMFLNDWEPAREEKPSKKESLPKAEPKPENLKETYSYKNEQGKELFQVKRYEKAGCEKTFRQGHFDASGAFVSDMQGVRRVLYQLPEVLAAKEVLLVEGEKDVESLRSHGFVATTSPMGASSWKTEYAESLRGKNVVIIPDNDEPGRKYEQTVTSSLVGEAASVRVVRLPGGVKDVSDWFEAGGTKEELLKLKEAAISVPEKPGESKPRYDSAVPHNGGPNGNPGRTKAPDTSIQQKEKEKTCQDDKWAMAKELFPKKSVPWDVFPSDLSMGLKQLARSCATSPTSLPGAAIAILSSVLGSTVAVCPKSGWTEPLIFWFADIRSSGSGKTPAPRKLLGPILEAQKKADREYEQKRSEWEMADKIERGQEPKRARGYFLTDLTLEGLREDISGHGGTFCILDELSTFISAQNQYRNGKGSDRESWLQLHDGNPVRIVRANKAKLINNARLNLFGGIQPAVWRSVFGGGKGLYLTDGTVFRMLPIYESESFYPLDGQTWDDEKKVAWETLLLRAMRWADNIISKDDWRPFKMFFDEQAEQFFYDWRNELEAYKQDLPDFIKGFIPKIAGAAVRLAGALYFIDHFSKSEAGPESEFLTEKDVRRGTNMAMFYMGHIVEACQVLSQENFTPGVEVTEHTRRLAETLSSLKPDIDSGRLAIGYIHERFNAGLKPELQIKSSKAMGALIRGCGLQIAPGRHGANGKAGVYCLSWGEETENFINKHVHEVHKPLMDKGLNHMDIEK